jgi:hypothetical protein
VAHGRRRETRPDPVVQPLDEPFGCAGSKTPHTRLPGYSPHPHVNPRYPAYGHTWLILSDPHAHGYHNAEREKAAKGDPLGRGFVLACRPETWPVCTSSGGVRVCL